MDIYLPTVLVVSGQASLDVLQNDVLFFIPYSLAVNKHVKQVQTYRL